MGTFTAALLEALLSAGVEPDRARAVVDLFDRSVDERYSLHAHVLATKRDLAELETRLSREIADVKVDLAGVKADVANVKVDVAGLKVDVAGVKSDLTSLKSEVAGMKVDLAKWCLGAMTAQTALLLGAVKLF